MHLTVELELAVFVLERAHCDLLAVYLHSIGVLETDVARIVPVHEYHIHASGPRRRSSGADRAHSFASDFHQQSHVHLRQLL